MYCNISEPLTSAESQAPLFVWIIMGKLFLIRVHSTDKKLVKTNYFWYSHYAFVNMEEEQYGGKGENFVKLHIN